MTVIFCFSPTESPEPDVEEKPEITGVEPEVPSGVDDFDKENLNDPYQVSLYAMDIFKYLKENEVSLSYVYFNKLHFSKVINL